MKKLGLVWRLIVALFWEISDALALSEVPFQYREEYLAELKRRNAK